MKKLLSAIICAAAMSLLAACGNSNPAPESGSDVTNAPQTSLPASGTGSVSESVPQSAPDGSAAVNASDFRYKNEDYGIEITDSSLQDENIVIPDKIDGKTVLEISNANGANKCLFPNAKTITLPETLKEIGDHAFEGCAALAEITIPASVDDIGEYAFKGCSSLTKIAIPARVDDIDDYAFEGCAALSEITIAEGVKELGRGVFSGCTSLTEIALPDSIKEVDAGAFDGGVSFTVTYKGKSYTPDNINELYTLLR